MICPNKKNPKTIALMEDVRRLARASEDDAWTLLSVNNGYPLDRNADGTPSDAFSRLARQYGSKEMAAQKRAQDMLQVFARSQYLYKERAAAAIKEMAKMSSLSEEECASILGVLRDEKGTILYAPEMEYLSEGGAFRLKMVLASRGYDVNVVTAPGVSSCYDKPSDTIRLGYDYVGRTPITSLFVRDLPKEYELPQGVDTEEMFSIYKEEIARRYRSFIGEEKKAFSRLAKTPFLPGTTATWEQNIADFFSSFLAGGDEGGDLRVLKEQDIEDIFAEVGETIMRGIDLVSGAIYRITFAPAEMAMNETLYYIEDVSDFFSSYIDSAERALSSDPRWGRSLDLLARALRERLGTLSGKIAPLIHSKVKEAVSTLYEGASLTEEEKKTLIETAIKQFEGSIPVRSWKIRAERLLGDTSLSSALPVRLAYIYTRMGEQKGREKLMETLSTLIRAQEEAIKERGGPNIRNINGPLMERDAKGRTTGFFTLPVSYSRYRADYDKMIEENPFRVKTADGRLIEEYPTETEKKRWITREEEWLSSRLDRPFITDYYIARRMTLSPETERVLRGLNRRREKILERYATPQGIYKVWEMTTKDRKALSSLDRKRAALASEWFLFEEDGVTKVLERKTGQALKMAEEIRSWRQWLRARRVQGEGRTLLEEDKERIKELFRGVEATADNDPYTDALNTYASYFYRKEATQAFYDRNFSSYGNGATLTLDAEERLRALKASRGALIRQIKEPGLYEKPQFDKSSPSFFRTLKDIEQEIQDIYDDKESYESPPQDSGIRPATVDYVYHRWLAPDEIEDWDDSGKRGKLSALRWVAANVTGSMDDLWVRKADGDSHPLSIFSTLLPTREEDVVLTPYSFYSRKYENKDYVKIEGEPRERPKLSLYKNAEWDKIEGKEKLTAYLRTLRETLREADRMLGRTAPSLPVRAPQIRARSSELLFSRGFGLSSPLKALLQTIKNATYINETDLDFADPDMKMAALKRFQGMLDDPSIISTDLVSSTFAYWTEAQRYRNMAETAQPALELFRRFSSKGSPKIAKAIEDLQEVYVARRQQSMYNRAAKIISEFTGLSTIALLSHNLRSVTKGGIDAAFNLANEAALSRVFDLSALYQADNAIRRERREAGAFDLIGNIAPRTKGELLFIYTTGQSKGWQKISGRASYAKPLRVVAQNIAMGEYTAVDRFFSKRVTLALYYSYGRAKLPGDKDYRFHTKREFMNALGDEEGKEAFSRAEKLYDLIETDPKRGTIKMPKGADDTLLARIRLQSERLISSINGTMTAGTFSARMRRNPGLNLLVSMRGYLLTNLNDRLRSASDFTAYHYNKKRGEMVRDKAKIRGMYDLVDGQIEDGTYRPFFRAMCRLVKGLAMGSFLHPWQKTGGLTAAEKYALRRTCLEMGEAIALTCLLYYTVPLICGAVMRNGAGDDDDEDDEDDGDNKISDTMLDLFALQATTYLMAAADERKAWYDPQTVTDVIASPSACLSTFRRFSYVIDLCEDLHDCYTWQNDEEDYGCYGREMKGGPWRGQLKMHKDLMMFLGSLSPIYNVYRSSSLLGVKQANNTLYKQNALQQLFLPFDFLRDRKKNIYDMIYTPDISDSSLARDLLLGKDMAIKKGE